MLDESCSVAASDDSLVLKIRNQHKAHPAFVIPKLNKDGFIIKHTAKDVEYTITGFRTKNKGILFNYMSINNEVNEINTNSNLSNR